MTLKNSAAKSIANSNTFVFANNSKANTIKTSVTSELILRKINVAPFGGQCDSLTGVGGGGNNEVVG